MKKLAFILAGLFVTAGADARHTVHDARLYYGQPLMAAARTRPTGEHFRNFDGCDERECDDVNLASAILPPPPAPTPQPESPRTPAPQNRTATSRNQITREHITNPFFQPGAGQFTSLTDVGYASNTINTRVSLDPATSLIASTDNWNYSSDMFTVSQNLAFGVTDDVVVIGNIRYAINDENFTQMGDTGIDSRVDTFGIGLRWMFVDNRDWVGYVQGNFQSVTDLAMMFSSRLQVGYKNDDTVLYVFGEVQYFDWNQGGGLGFGVTNNADQTLVFEVQSNPGNIHFETGAGAFMAFNNEWALDASVALAHRDWHRQVYGQLKLNYQPWDNAAVSIYGRWAMWDNITNLSDMPIFAGGNFADGGGNPVFHPWPTQIGTADVIGANNFSVGAQLTLLF